MDALLEGDPVVEQILEPSESLVRGAARLLNFVKGEYQDEDGDSATAFILADTPPPPESRVSVFSSLGKNNNNNSRRGDCCCCSEEILPSPPHNASSSSSSHTCAPKVSGSTVFLQQKKKTGKAAGGPPVELGNRKDNDVVFLLSDTDDDDDDEESCFFCELCEESAGLDSIASMLSCTCLVCVTCVQLHVVSLLTGAATSSSTTTTTTQQEEGNQQQQEEEEESRFGKEDSTKDVMMMMMLNMSGGETETEKERMISKEEFHDEPLPVESYTRVLPKQQLEWIPCPKPSCSGQISLSASQILAPEAFRLWEEAANETLFEENTAFVKCPGCKVVFEKVTGVVPPGVALTGVPELDRTAPFIELDNEGHRLSRSAMCHKAANRFRCRMCSMDFCGLCMVCPYHLGKACEEVEEEKNSTN